jgi:hypothetical protein
MGRRSIPREGPPEAQGALHHNAMRRRRKEEFTLTPTKRPGPQLELLFWRGLPGFGPPDFPAASLSRSPAHRVRAALHLN